MQRRKNKHSVSMLLCHFVFVVKYRRRVITESVWASIRAAILSSAERIGVVVVEANHNVDHVNLVVEYSPDITASKMAGALKGNSSFTVRCEYKSELSVKLWGKAFWNPSYFVASCGGAPIEVIRQYVQGQGKAKPC